MLDPAVPIHISNNFRIIKNSNLFYKDGLLEKLGTTDDVTKKGTVDTTFF